MPLNGNTQLIAHVGYPTSTFKAPMIYNPYFDNIGLNACVVPMGVRDADFAVSLPAILRMSNVLGALITMPHKISVMAMLGSVSDTAAISGACNAVRRGADGRLEGDMFDGEGFVRGIARKGRTVAGASALVVGAGGVGSAIAASLAKAGLERIGLHDINPAMAEALAARLAAHYPRLVISTGSNDPAGFDIVINATPLGMVAGDPMPVDMARVAPSSFVGEVVMKQAKTAFLMAAEARGCQVQPGIDMLFEQIPAYLDFFGLPATTPETLRSLAQISY